MANGIRLGKLRKEIKRKSVLYSHDLVLAAQKRALCGEYSLNSGGMYPDLSSRDYYWAVPRSTWKKIVKHFGVWKRPYDEDQTDCDDYAKALLGKVSVDLGVTGIAYVRDNTALHAYNCLLVENNGQVDWLFFEPQSLDFVEQLSDRYQMRSGEVTFG